MWHASRKLSLTRLRLLLSRDCRNQSTQFITSSILRQSNCAQEHTAECTVWPSRDRKRKTPHHGCTCPTISISIFLYTNSSLSLAKSSITVSTLLGGSSMSCLPSCVRCDLEWRMRIWDRRVCTISSASGSCAFHLSVICSSLKAPSKDQHITHLCSVFDYNRPSQAP